MGRGAHAAAATGQALLFGPRHQGQRPQAVEPWFTLDADHAALLNRFIHLPATDPGVPVDDRGKTMHYVYAYPRLSYQQDFLDHFIVVAVGTRHKAQAPTAQFGSMLYGRRNQDGNLGKPEPFYLGDQRLVPIMLKFNRTRSTLVKQGWQGQAVVARSAIEASISRYLGRALGTVRPIEQD